MDEAVKQWYFKRRPLGTTEWWPGGAASALRQAKAQVRNEAFLRLQGVCPDALRELAEDWVMYGEVCEDVGPLRVNLHTAPDAVLLDGYVRDTRVTGRRDGWYGQRCDADYVHAGTWYMLEHDFRHWEHWQVKGMPKDVAVQRWYAAQDHVVARIKYPYLALLIGITAGGETDWLGGIDIDPSAPTEQQIEDVLDVMIERIIDVL